MTSKQVIPRAQAIVDVENAIDFYLNRGEAQAAMGFVDALAIAYRHIASFPNAGSERYASRLGLAGLRFWPLSDYPYLVFYVDRSDHVDVWRVLHAQRDIPA
jgi:toxin ParE1/3/4